MERGVPGSAQGCRAMPSEDEPRGPERLRSLSAALGGAGPVALRWPTRAAYQGMRTRMPGRSQMGRCGGNCEGVYTQVASALGESSPNRIAAGGRWRWVPWAPCSPPPRRAGRQLNPESGAPAGPCRLAPRAHFGPRRAGARACPTRRPGVGPGVTPSARLGSWRAATVWWDHPRQECGASSMGSLASPAPRPGRRVVSSPRGGAFHPSLGVPRGSRPSASRGAVRRAVPGGHERDGVRVGLLMPKAAGDSSSWTPGVRAAVWRAAAPRVQSRSSCPQRSSRNFHRSASTAAADRRLHARGHARISYLQSALRTEACDYRRGPRSVSRSRRLIGDAFGSCDHGAARTDGDDGCLRPQVYAHDPSHVAAAVQWCLNRLLRSRRGSDGG